MTKGRSQIRSFPTPLIEDVLFYQVGDASLHKWAERMQKGMQHYDSLKWPDHICIDIQPLADQGDNVFAYFFAADRENQDKYNWEHSKADIGGFKFDTVTRSYIIRRDDYSATSPALGSVMPDTPTGRFDAANFHLVKRGQYRISERARRAQSTIGQPEMDSQYVVEVRTYIDREQIVRSTYDDSVNGVLYTRQDIYIRGETYDSGDTDSSADDVKIEDAYLTASYWGVGSGGQLKTVEQVSDDAWIVTTQDMIPQSGLPSDSALFGGTVLRVYETKRTFTWPAVLGDDGSGTGWNGSAITGLIGDIGVEIMDWEMKDGGSRNFDRPLWQRNGYRGPTRMVIHQEWLTQEELDAADIDVVTTMQPKPIDYPSPYLPVSISPSLHGVVYFQSDTGTSDPKYAANVGSTRYFPATTQTDWPASLVVDCPAEPFRGGYIVTRVTAYRPYA
jgi:hypothetical protein